MDDVLKSNILEVCDKKYHYLMGLANVVGVGLGYKYINSINTFMPSIHVLVDKKIHSNFLGKDNIIPKSYLGITTDVIETGKFYARALTNKVRPLQGGYGISIKNANKDLVGSIGCILVKGTVFKDYYILTNNHVIVRDNTKIIPEQILQPAVDDGGVYPKDLVATLTDYIPLKFKTSLSSPNNYMDAAIAKLKSSSLKSNLIGLIGKIQGIADPISGEKIKMAGSTTGLSRGYVLTIGVTGTVNYPSSKKSAFFKNQVSIAMNNKGGDSGTVVLNEKNQIIGLFFSGTEKKVGMMTPIKPILNIFKADVYK